MPLDLPRDLALPLSSGQPYWYWLSGRRSLDFVNTFRERWRRRVETLVTPRDLVTWLQASGLELAEPDADGALLEGARELREAINVCFEAIIAGQAVPEPSIAHINSWLREAVVAPMLRLDSAAKPALITDEGSLSVAAALGAVALDAAQVIGDPTMRTRVRICESETCSARFFDRSPGGRRRWCSMEGCGNVAKARRHRARQRPIAQ